MFSPNSYSSVVYEPATKWSCSVCNVTLVTLVGHLVVVQYSTTTLQVLFFELWKQFFFFCQSTPFINLSTSISTLLWKINFYIKGVVVNMTASQWDKQKCLNGKTQSKSSLLFGSSSSNLLYPGFIWSHWGVFLWLELVSMNEPVFWKQWKQPVVKQI